MLYCRRAMLANIQAYKSMLAAHDSAELWRDTVDRLVISRMQLRQSSDAVLYASAGNILAVLVSRLAETARTASWYSGMDEFYEHFKAFLASVTVYDDCLVYKAQKAACALVHSIQILCLPMEACSGLLTERLYRYGSLVASLGDDEVQQAYVAMLTDSRVQDHALARSLLAEFHSVKGSFRIGVV